MHERPDSRKKVGEFHLIRLKGGCVAAIYAVFGALLPLTSPGHYIQWHWIQISVANLIVIILMIATFIAALVLPFPGRRRRRGGDE